MAMPIIFIVVTVLVLGGLAVAGLAVWHFASETPGPTVSDPTVTGAKTTKDSASETASPREAIRYWLEIESPEGTGTTRVAGDEPIASGQSFKVHFVSQQNGYLYIVGPGEDDVLTTFLTTKPIEGSVQTNQTKQGADFSFPDGADNWITLDKTTGTEDYTVIFSPTPIDSISVLDEQAGGVLTESEQKEFKAFVEKHSDNRPVSETLSDSSGHYVSVKVPGKTASSDPVIFEIRLKHK
jgi:hypothetical protein